MRILAIRGKNLASLAGEFSIDFREEPLQSSGLFAISGPTGAGKSTLLDALCVALYDATPRLLRAGARGIALPDVRDEVVSPQDSRNLLRRGASEGHAEVEFLGNDGIAYRARWSVRRARARADGSLQKTAMSLLKLPEGQPLGGTNSEVKAEIAQRIGLSFEQFTRAVLLAQNEFSAFLKTDDNERGELLETLTGNLVYTEISRLAFERAKQEAAATQRLSEQLAGNMPIADQERAALEQASREAQAALAGIEARLETLSGRLRWRQETARLKAAEEEARAAWVRHRERQEAAAERAQLLARIDAAQPARPLVAESLRITADIERTRSAMNACQARLEAAGAAQAQAQRQAERTARELHAAELEISSSSARLDQAKALDARIDAMRPAHADALRARDEAVAAVQAAQDALAEKDRERMAALARQREIDAWLAAHADAAPLAESWQRWDILFAQARRQADECAEAASQATAARMRHSQCARAAQDADALLAAAGAAQADCLSRRDGAAEALGRLEAKRSPGARHQAQRERDQLAEAEQLCLAQHDIRSRRHARCADAERHAAAAAAALALQEQALAARPALAAALAQAERSLKIAEAACGETAERLRATLEDGTPCPVCGSPEHPYSHGDPRLAGMLAGLRQELASRAQEDYRNREQIATQRALAEAARAAHGDAAASVAALDAELAALESRWRGHALHRDDPRFPDAAPSECAAWLKQRREIVAARLRELDAADEAAGIAARERDAAQAALDGAARQLAARQAEANASRLALTDASRSRSTAEERQAELAARMTATLAELDGLALGADWKSAWQAAPDAFHARCREQATAWRERKSAGDACAAALETIALESQALRQAWSAAQADSSRAASAFSALDANQAAMRHERSTLFDGKPVRDIEQAITASLRAARAAHEQASASAQACALEAGRCAEALDRSRERLAELQADSANCAAGIADWLALHNAGSDQASAELGDEGLRALLAFDAEWIRGEREALQALMAATDEARTVLRERASRFAAHELARPVDAGDEPLEELEHALRELGSQRQALQQRLAELRVTLSRDDARRGEFADMAAKIREQEAAQRRWAQLSDLIGSADGKKFRNYAQQTTLDVLLAYANRHLAELSRRYRLERVPDTLALMVVDQDMAEELRSVHSLSGGESFLVSLALALGLASLSSNRVRVESLFIDEGFGSLDAETLRVAMDALDGLQSLGRKVGVISHVQEMTERIATRIVVRRTSGGSSQVSVNQG